MLLHAEAQKLQLFVLLANAAESLGPWEKASLLPGAGGKRGAGNAFFTPHRLTQPPGMGGKTIHWDQQQREPWKPWRLQESGESKGATDES